jgi:hypothetical protein
MLGSNNRSAAPAGAAHRGDHPLPEIAASREFLLFITEQAFQGYPQDITEQMIGCQVFGRSPGYNQAEDNIVRVSCCRG